MKGMSMNYVSVWVTNQALPAPLHEVISALTHSVCQGHTLPLRSVADFEVSQPWTESLALSSRWFSNSFQEMSTGFPPTSPFWLLAVHWNTSSDATAALGWLVCTDTLSTTNLLHFLLSILSSWLIHTTKNQIYINLQGSWAYRAPAPHICWGIG